MWTILWTVICTDRWTGLRHARRWLAAAAVLVLAGCATMPGVMPGQLQRAQNIAIASLAGDVAWFGYTGITIFENSESTLPVADWGLDARIETATVEALRQAGATKSTVLAIDRASLAQVFRTPRLPSAVSERWDNPAFRDPLLSAARAAGADLLVIVLPEFNPPVQHRGERLYGFSVSAGGSPLRSHPAVITAILAAEVVAIDVASAQVLASRTVYADPKMNPWNGTRPSEKLEPTQWERGFKAPPDGERLALVRAAFDKLTQPVGGAVVRLLDPPPASDATPRPNTPR